MTSGVVLAYHTIDTAFDWGITRVTPDQMVRHIQWTIDNGFQIVDLATCVQAQPEKKYAAITFDDAYESIYDYAYPILSDFNLTATIFVITSYIGQYNSWDANIGGLRFKHLNWCQLKELKAAGWRIESHGSTHVDLTRVTAQRLKRELRESQQILENRLGSKVEYFSYPFGKVNQQVAQIMTETGFSYGFTLNRHDFPNVIDRLRIPRQGIYWTETRRSFTRKLLQRQQSLGRFFQWLLHHCAQGTSVYKGWLKQKKT